MRQGLFLPAIVWASLMTHPASAGVSCQCPADFNMDGSINGLDLGILLINWSIPPGTPGCGGAVPCAADLNGNGAVDGLDLGILLGQWGSCQFDYGQPFPDAEAFQIALEMLGPNGPLLPTAATLNRIDRDLDLIRQAYPALASQTHTLAWAPNRLIVGLIQGQPMDQFQCLNAYYGVTNVQNLFAFGGIQYVVITLGGSLNVEALGQIYAALPEVNSAEPDGLIGGQNFWEPVILSGGAGGLWRWNIDDGFHDCFDGCDCHYYYVIDIDGRGNLTLISFQQIGASWCPWPI